MANENKVYTHVEQFVIPSSHGANVNYIVSYGYVDWKRMVHCDRLYTY